jgi:Group II intron, maturase-specific domain
VDAARRILKQLGVELHPQKTRIVHVRYGFEFLGYKIKRGYRKLHLPESKIRSQARQDALYAYPKEKSIRRFMDQVRQRTKRTMPLQAKELLEELNPLLRGWGEYYKTRPHPKALPTSRRLGPAAHLVASLQALAQCWLETAAHGPALWRVRACSSDRLNSFSCISA